ncbi:MAG: YncE family protein [Deltaproteobacteria bacterium]
MIKTNAPTYTCNRLPFAAIGLLLLFLLLAVLTGCVPTVKESSEPLADLGNEQDTVNTARLSLFLNLKDPTGPGIRLELKDLEVLADQIWLPVTSGPLLLDSEKIADSQVFLGGRAMPPGRYDRLRFTVSQSSLRQANGEYKTVTTDPYLMDLVLSTPLLLDKDDSRSLFITWDARGSLEGPSGLHPVMAVSPPLRQLFIDLVYVACPDINTIFIIRSDKNWVADSFGVKGHPTYIAMDPDPSNQRLYVLAARESRIKTVELNSQRVVDSFPIPLAIEPSFMTISPDGQWVYVLDESQNYLSRLDLESGRLLDRVRLGYEPQYVAYLADQNFLAVSSVISQTVSFRDPQNLSEVGSVHTGSSPDGLLVSNNLLYIAERGANTVSVVDLTMNKIQSRVDVGLGPRRLLDNGSQIYVSNYDDGSLSVIYPGQLEVGREIYGLGRPLEMVYDQNYRRIYVGDEKEAGLAIIDSNINQLKGYIKLGARPLGLAIIQ